MCKIDLRQGDVVSEKTLQELLKSPSIKLFTDTPDGNFSVVLTQDCDIAQPPLSEPYVEFIVGKQITNKDGNYFNNRNPRVLQIENGGCFFEFSVHNRFFIKKENLKKIDIEKHDISLSSDNKRLLKLWMGRRYTRAAFPDNFNARARKSFTIADKEISKNVNYIYFEVEDREIESLDEPYKLNIIIVVDSGIPKEEMQKIQDAYEKAFDVDGIEALPRVLTKDEVTLADLEKFQRWDKDCVSISKKQPGPMNDIDSLP
jgi:hypothetical protein